MLTNLTRLQVRGLIALFLWPQMALAHGGELVVISAGLALFTFLAVVIWSGLMWRASILHKVILLLAFIAAYPVGWFIWRFIVYLFQDDVVSLIGGWAFLLAFPPAVWILGVYLLRPNRTVERDGRKAARLSP